MRHTRSNEGKTYTLRQVTPAYDLPATTVTWGYLVQVRRLRSPNPPNARPRGLPWLKRAAKPRKASPLPEPQALPNGGE